jgi:regulator of extracellular matrix RemA (YlzA/DUF370 family)
MMRLCESKRSPESSALVGLTGTALNRTIVRADRDHGRRDRAVILPDTCNTCLVRKGSLLKLAN